MRILWIHERYFDIGIDRATWQEMIICLKQMGCHLTLVTSYKEKPINLGFPIVYIPCVRIKFLHYLTFNLYAMLWLLRESHKWDAIIVELNSILSTMPLVLLQKVRPFKRVNLFLDLRTIPVHPSRFWYYLGWYMLSLAVKIARRWFVGITVITPALKDFIVKYYQVKPEKISIWTSGVNLEHFNPTAVPKEGRARLQKELGLEGKFVIMYHGSLATNRGLQEAIQAVALACAKTDALHLVLLGKGPARDQLEVKVKQLGIAKQVTFLDAVDYKHVPHYVALADVGLLPFPDLPQWKMSSPLKLLEYLAMGKPVVLTDIEAHRLVLPQDHPCAFYAGTNCPEQLAIAILRAWAALSSAEYRQLCQAKGRQLIEERFTWKQQAKSLFEFLSAQGAAQEKNG